MQKKLLLCMIALLGIITVGATNTLPITFTNKEGLPGESDGIQYTWSSGNLTLSQAVSKLRLTVLSSNTADNGAGYPCFALAELYIYDENGERIILTEEDFSTNAQEFTEGALKNICDDNTGTYFHSRWSNSSEVTGEHYVEVSLPEPLTSFTIEYISRNLRTVPQTMVLTAGTDYNPYPDYELETGEKITSIEQLSTSGYYALYNPASNSFVSVPFAGGLRQLRNYPTADGVFKLSWAGDGTYYIQNLNTNYLSSTIQMGSITLSQSKDNAGIFSFSQGIYDTSCFYISTNDYSIGFYSVSGGWYYLPYMDQATELQLFKVSINGAISLPVTLTTDDELPGTSDGKQYSWTSGSFKSIDAVEKLRFTVLSSNTGDHGAGYVCFALAELYIYDENGEALALDATHFTTNAQEYREGPLEDICDNNLSTYFHSRWSDSSEETGDHYVEVTLPEPMKTFSFGYVSRNLETVPTTIVVSNGMDDVEPVDSTYLGKTFIIESASENFYILQSSYKAMYADAASQKLGWGNELAMSGITDEQFYWTVERPSEKEWADSGYYYIKNCFTNSYISFVSSRSTDIYISDTPSPYKFLQFDNDRIAFESVEAGATEEYCLHAESHSSGNGPAGDIVYWDASSDCSQWYLKEVVAKEPELEDLYMSDTARYVYLKDGTVMGYPINMIADWYSENGLLYIYLVPDNLFYHKLSDVDSVSYIKPMRNNASITSFKFNNKYNEDIDTDVICTIDEETRTITGAVTKIGKYLTPSFQTDVEATVTVNGIPQQSKVSRVNFSNDVIYSIEDSTLKRFGWERIDDDTIFYTVNMGKEYTVKIDWACDEAEVPRIDIDIDDGDFVTSKEYYLHAKITIDGGGMFEDFTDSVYIKGRGNSTWSGNKLPYRLKFNEKVKLFGLKSGKSWVLLACAQDPTLMDHAIGFKAGQLVGAAYTNHSIPVELYMNGKYLGSYHFTEKLGINNNSVDEDDLSPFFELDTNYDEPYKFYSDTYGLPVMVHNPDFVDDYADVSYEVIDSMFQEIRADYNAMEVAVESGDFEDVINIDTLVRFMLANDLSLNLEIMHPKSTYLYKPYGSNQYYFGPIWDLDWGYAYEIGGYFSTYQYQVIYPLFGSTSSYRFFYQLFTHEAVKKAYYRLWRDFVANHLQEVIDYVDDYSTFAQSSYQHNAEAGYGSSAYPSYLSRMKAWLNDRAQYIYNNLTPYEDEPDTIPIINPGDTTIVNPYDTVPYIDPEDTIPISIKNSMAYNDDIKISIVNGTLCIESPIETLLPVYAANGKQIALMKVMEGHNLYLLVPKGVFIVNRQKIRIR